MKLESQVCSLDLAKRLKELGVKQESLFTWLQWGEDGENWDVEVSGGKKSIYEQNTAVSAFTVAELGEVLNVRGVGDVRLSLLGADGWICFATTVKGGERHFTAPTMADALAKMLIYLIENKLIIKV